MTTSTVKKTISWWDWSGIFFSGLCLLHCIATPILLAGASIWLLSEWVHWTLLILLVPIVFIASMRTRRNSEKRWPIYLMFAGISVLFIALLAEEMVGEAGEIGITIAGSVLLIAGHWGNRHLHGCGEA